MRAVLDTGVLVSALIRRQGTTGEVLSALRDGRYTIVYSTDILMEIIEVLGRPLFHSKYYIEPEDVASLINLIRLRGEIVSPKRRITLCRDPQDNKFLEAALESQANCIVTGDADLLDIIVIENIPILRPAEFLERL